MADNKDAPKRPAPVGPKQVNHPGNQSGRKVRSARGEWVDFDLLKIKAEINNAPMTIDIVARERFIDKRRRRTNRKADEMLAQQAESKRYAEEAIKQQQEAKANQPSSPDQPVIEVVAAEKPVTDEQKVKLNRKLNK